MLKKIVSGGQTGVDRCALDVAIELNYEYGGWCSRGRKAEDGIIDQVTYSNLIETSTDEYPQRTKFNVTDSDGTLIIINSGENSIGRRTKLTINTAKKYKKPLFIFNLNENNINLNEIKIIEWILTNNIQILNITGPREETTPGIHSLTQHFLRSLLNKIRS